MLAADCNWTVNGTVKVETQQDDLRTKFGSQIPLKGIQVKVSGATIGGFDSWDTVSTDSDGKFTVRKSKSCEDRKLKIEVQFENDKIKVMKDPGLAPTTGAKWYTIIQDTERRRKAGAIQIVPTVFASGKNLDLNDADARDHADIWVIANALHDHLASFGTNFKFTAKTVIEYPNNDQFINDNAEASFTNPVTRDVNIFRSNDGKEDHLHSSTLFHEMMHLWAYQHTSGEIDLATNLLATGSTHCVNTKEHISFHEGFAEFAMEKLMEDIFPASYPTKSLPFNRDALMEGMTCEGQINNINTLLDMEQHEYGWMSLLRTLTTKGLVNYTYKGDATSRSRFNSSVFISDPAGLTALQGTCSSPDLKFKDVLGVFLPHSNKGFSDNLKKSEMNLNSFLNRAAKIHGFEDRNQGIKNLLDPAKTTEPKEELCSSTARPIVIGTPRPRP